MQVDGGGGKKWL